MPGFEDGFLGVPDAAGQAARDRAHARHRQGPEPAGDRGPVRHRGRVRRHRQARLGHGLRHEQPREEDRPLPPLRDARRLRRHVLRGGLRAGQDRRVQALADRVPLLARRDLRRHDRDPARPEARADRRLRARLHRPLRGRLEGRRGEHRAVPVGAVDARGARRGRLARHRRGPRGRHRRHLPPERRAPHGPRRRDRALRPLRDR